MAEALQSINNKTFGTSSSASFPVVTLPNGDKVPTGTVGALLLNIKAYDAATTAAERAALEPAIRAAVPVLQQVGMFDLFRPAEWVSGESPGRALVGKVAMEQMCKDVMEGRA
ncbi:hypothetical protein K4F52_004399 [Lecanicillium sp. MT-2017a]|nr:hypothetical protein K4F52_004399 [Lecanicillium sp. MT-2017a]